MSYDPAIDVLLNYRGPLTPPNIDIDTRTLNRAHELWQEAQPITGTLAARDLAETSGIDVDL